MIPDKMVCEDIIQNLFLKFFENLNKIRNKNSIRFWLYKAARNDVYSYYRSKKIKVDQFNVEDSNELETNSPENVAAGYELKEMKEILIKELDKMHPEQKEVFLLKEYGELSYKEISAVMEIDENLVKSRLFKIRQKLIKRLSQVL